jgi:hypothetical protein
VFVTGIAVGSIYSLMGMGLFITYLTTKAMNFGQGDFLMIAAFLSMSLAVAGVTAIAAVPAVFLVLVLLGVLLERVAVRPLSKSLAGSAGSFAWILTTLGFGMLLQNTATIVWGKSSFYSPPLFSSGDKKVVNLLGAGLYLEEIVVAIESGAPTATELTSQALKLKNAGAELVLLFHDSLELLYRSMPKADYKPVVAGNWGLSSLKVLEIVGKEGLEGTVMGQALDLADPKAAAFDEKMRKEFGNNYRWPVVAALGYDGMKLLLKAIDTAGADPTKIRDALEGINDFSAVSGTPVKPFGPKDHECLDPENVFLGVWRDGRVVRLK